MAMFLAFALTLAIPAIAQIGKTEESNPKPSYQTQAVARRSQSGLLAISNQHSDTTTALNSQNVGSLQLAWQIDTDDFVSHSPLTDGDRLYFSAGIPQPFGAGKEHGIFAYTVNSSNSLSQTLVE